MEADERDWRESYDDSRVHANRHSGFATPDANVTAADDDDNVNNFRSEVQFVSAYEHVPDEEDDDNADDDDDKSDDEDDEDEDE